MVENVPRWKAEEHLPAAAYPGARIFATAGCTACHTYDGDGGSNLGAPDLTAIGGRRLGIRFQIRHLKCPSCVNPGSPMPPFDSLGAARLYQLAVFLEASKGTH
jgi:cytochrome c oxidase subunit II